MGIKEFDLNIEKILENWEVHHAIREIIANALDEQTITQTKEVQIYNDGLSWHIKDYGRGLNYHHLTQNENEEKVKCDNVIGRFGVGLKDALATLYRHGIDVKIISKYGVITLVKSSKKGFDDITTLHANIQENLNNKIIGTDFVISGCKRKDIEEAKELFLMYNNEKILDTTAYGSILKKKGSTANIYINGIKVAEETNFLFSYNITSLTKQLKKALNRERTNVGRAAYTDRVKTILISSKNEEVIELLSQDLEKYSSGTKHDEVGWNDVSMHASKILSVSKKNIIFVDPTTAMEEPAIIDEIKIKGFQPVIVSENLVDKIDEYNHKKEATPIPTANKFIEDLKKDRQYDFVDVAELTKAEKKVFNKTKTILNLIGGMPSQVKDLKISNTIDRAQIFVQVVGLWDSNTGTIIIKRSQLESLESYAATLIHECMHAQSGFGDVTRNFETALTSAIGKIVAKSVL